MRWTRNYVEMMQTMPPFVTWDEEVVIPDKEDVIPDEEDVIADEGVVIPDSIRDPVLRGDWIAGQARNDKWIDLPKNKP